MPTTFLIVRHGQTAWNRDIRFRGTVDLPLSRHGRAQARRVRRCLRGQPIQAVYSSPLTRAIETARPLADALGQPVIPDGRLISVDYGDWQGHSPREVADLWPDTYALWLRSPDQVTFSSADSLLLVRDRLVGLVQELHKAYPDQAVALFSHEVVTTVAMLLALNLDFSSYWRIPQATGCINAFSYEAPKWSLLYLNDTCHLKGLAQR
jgi:broad specificity phosphatase PhoE